MVRLSSLLSTLFSPVSFCLRGGQSRAINGPEHLQQAVGGTYLLNHLVSLGEQCGRHGEAERIRGLQIDDEVEFGGLLDGEVGRLLLPECLDDFIHESNPVRVIDAFVDALDLGKLGFDGVVTRKRRGGLPTTHQRC